MESACVVLGTNKHYQMISNVSSGDPFRISCSLDFIHVLTSKQFKLEAEAYYMRKMGF